jgi:signal transduction histidine kinase
VQVLDATAGSILLIDESTRQLSFRAVVGPDESERLVGMQVPMGYGVIGWVAQNGKAALVDDVRKDPRFYRGIDQTTGLQTINVVAVPLLIKRQVMGVLELLNKTEGKFNEDDLHVAETLAQWAAAAIENARLVSNLRVHADQLEKAYTELKEADTLKDELIQNVSHELRTPLAFILGYIELMQTEGIGPLNAQQKEGLEVVRRKCVSLTKLVDDIVSLQKLRVTGLDRHPTNMNALLQHVYQAGTIIAEKGEQKLSLDLPPSTVIAAVDEDRIEQVLDNLLGNAVKFSAPGGQIVMRLREVDGQAQLEVQDMGIGIATDKIDRIFDRFYQVDGSATRRYGGMGLGLSICFDIVDAHGGRIWVESEEGKGSTFKVSLPKA